LSWRALGGRASNTPSAALGLALGFEVKQFLGDACAVDLVATLRDGLLQLGHAILVDDGLIAQLFADRLQLLGLTAQLNLLAGLVGLFIGLAGDRRLGGLRRLAATSLSRAGTPRVGRCIGIIQPIEIDDHDAEPRTVWWTLAKLFGHRRENFRVN